MSKKIETARVKIGGELRQLRVERGTRQDFIAKKLGVTSSNVCRMERGDFGPWSLELIQKWYAVFGITVDVGEDGFTIKGKPARNFPIGSLKPARQQNGKRTTSRPKSKSKRVVRKRKLKRKVAVKVSRSRSRRRTVGAMVGD